MKKDEKVKRVTDSGNRRNTESLHMGDKHVKGYPEVGPVEFRSAAIERMHGFKQAKTPVSRCRGPNRVIGKDPTPHQEFEPFWSPKWA